MTWRQHSGNFENPINPEYEQEARLVEQARAGSERAFSALLARYQQPVFRLIFYLVGEEDDARDLARIALKHALLHMPRVPSGYSIRPWLLRVAVLVALDAVRERSESPQQLLASMQLPAPPQTPKIVDADPTMDDTMLLGVSVRQLAQNPQTAIADAWDALPVEIERELIRRLLAGLPEGDAELLALGVVGQVPTRDLAALAGTSQRSIRRRIARALILFQGRYQEVRIEALPPAAQAKELPRSTAASPLEAARRGFADASDRVRRGLQGVRPHQSASDAQERLETLLSADMPAATAAMSAADTIVAPAIDVGLETQPLTAEFAPAPDDARQDHEPANATPDETPERVMSGVFDPQSWESWTAPVPDLELADRATEALPVIADDEPAKSMLDDAPAQIEPEPEPILQAAPAPTFAADPAATVIAGSFVDLAEPVEAPDDAPDLIAEDVTDAAFTAAEPIADEVAPPDAEYPAEVETPVLLAAAAFAEPASALEHEADLTETALLATDVEAPPAPVEAAAEPAVPEGVAEPELTLADMYQDAEPLAEEIAVCDPSEMTDDAAPPDALAEAAHDDALEPLTVTAEEPALADAPAAIAAPTDPALDSADAGEQITPDVLPEVHANGHAELPVTFDDLAPVALLADASAEAPLTEVIVPAPEPATAEETAPPLEDTAFLMDAPLQAAPDEAAEQPVAEPEALVTAEPDMTEEVATLAAPAIADAAPETDEAPAPDAAAMMAAMPEVAATAPEAALVDSVAADAADEFAADGAIAADESEIHADPIVEYVEAQEAVPVAIVADTATASDETNAFAASEATGTVPSAEPPRGNTVIVQPDARSDYLARHRPPWVDAGDLAGIAGVRLVAEGEQEDAVFAPPAVPASGVLRLSAAAEPDHAAPASHDDPAAEPPMDLADIAGLVASAPPAPTTPDVVAETPPPEAPARPRAITRPMPRLERDVVDPPHEW